MESSCCPYNRHQITDFFSGNDIFCLNCLITKTWRWVKVGCENLKSGFKNVKQTLYSTGPFILYSFNGLIGNVQICNCLFLRMFYRENEENLIQIIRKLIKKKVFSVCQKNIITTFILLNDIKLTQQLLFRNDWRNQ